MIKHSRKRWSSMSISDLKRILQDSQKWNRAAIPIREPVIWITKRRAYPARVPCHARTCDTAAGGGVEAASAGDARRGWDFRSLGRGGVNFEEIVRATPVPIVVAGGKKVAERDALQMAHNAVQAGACGVDMGRNIFQSDCPVGMIRAVRAVVHQGAGVDEAFEIYNREKTEDR